MASAHGQKYKETKSTIPQPEPSEVGKLAQKVFKLFNIKKDSPAYQKWLHSNQDLEKIEIIDNLIKTPMPTPKKKNPKPWEVSKANSDLTATLYNRGTVHGKFADNAKIAHDLKQVVRTASPLYNRLTPVQKEAIDNILMKLSRIISGNPNHIDAWRDVAGYATLVMDDLKNTDGATDTIPSVVTMYGGKETVVDNDLKD